MKLYKIIIFTLFFAILTSLVGCGYGQNNIINGEQSNRVNNNKISQNKEIKYDKEKIILPEEVEAVQDFCITENYIFVIGKNTNGYVIFRQNNEGTWESAEIQDNSYDLQYISSYKDLTYALAVKDSQYYIVHINDEANIVPVKLPADERFAGLLVYSDGVLLWNYSSIYKIDPNNGELLAHRDASSSSTINELTGNEENIYAQLNINGVQKIITVDDFLYGKESYIEVDCTGALTPVCLSKSPYILIGELSKLTRLNVDNGQISTALSWLDLGITEADLISKIVEFSDGTIFLSDLYANSIYKLVPSENDERIEIEIATAGVSPQLANAINQFNSVNTDYKVSAKIYNINELDRLRTEIMSGSGPDIIDTFSFPLAGESIGIYENLLPYIEKDKTISKDDFLENIFEASAKNDALYYVMPTFKIRTMVSGNSEIVIEPQTELDEYMECLSTAENSNTTESLDSKSSPIDVLSAVFPVAMNEIIDIVDGKQIINSEKLAYYLLFSESIGNYDVIPAEISNCRKVSALSKQLGNAVNYVRYPSKLTSGVYAEPSFICFAMLSTSEYKNIAWEFLRQFFSEDYQNENTQNWGFPTRRDCFEKYLSAAVEDEEIKLTPEEADKLREYILEIDVVNFYDKRLEDIVITEAQKYFSGSKSIDEVVKIISSKGNTYLAEIE